MSEQPSMSLTPSWVAASLASSTVFSVVTSRPVYFFIASVIVMRGQGLEKSRTLSPYSIFSVPAMCIAVSWSSDSVRSIMSL